MNIEGILDNANSQINYYQNKMEMLETKRQVDEVNKKVMSKNDNKIPTKELGKDEFLKLLITELKHQDPTNPMEDREFIAQMAQFSSLEQMLNLNKGMTQLIDNISFQSSFNLLGQNVQIDTQETDGSGNKQFISGMVESVSKNGNEIFVRVNGNEYPAAGIVSVGN